MLFEELRTDKCLIQPLRSFYCKKNTLSPKIFLSLNRKVTSQNKHFQKLNQQNKPSQTQFPLPKMLTQILKILLNLTQKVKTRILWSINLELSVNKYEDLNFHFSLTSQNGIFSSEFFPLHFSIFRCYF